MTTCSIDTREFDAALREYYNVSKSTLADIINRKAFFIALRAMGKTPVMSRADFTRSMRREVWGQREGRPGGLVKRIYAMAQKRWKKSHGKGAYGETMRQAAREFSRSRITKRGYLKSGWLPAIVVLGRKYGRAAGYKGGVAFSDKAVIQAGKYNPKNGFVTEAKPAENCFAAIGNMVASAIKGAMSGAVHGKAETALKDAFNYETASMLKEVEKRLIDDSIKLGMRAAA